MMRSYSWLATVLGLWLTAVTMAQVSGDDTSVNVTVGKLFSASGIAFKQDGTLLADPTQWAGKTIGGKSVLVESTEALHRRGKTTFVIEKQDGIIRGVTRITGANGDGRAYAKVAATSGKAMGSLTECENDSGKIVCLTVNGSLCRTIRALSPSQDLEKLRDSLAECGKINRIFPRAFSLNRASLVAAEKGNLARIRASNDEGFDRFDLGAPTMEGDAGQRLSISDLPVEAIAGLLGDSGRYRRYDVLDMCESAFGAEMSGPLNQPEAKQKEGTH